MICVRCEGKIILEMSLSTSRFTNVSSLFNYKSVFEVIEGHISSTYFTISHTISIFRFRE